MGSLIFQGLQSPFVSYHPPTTNTETARRSLPCTSNDNKTTIELKQISKDLNCTVYMASVCGINFTLKTVHCPIEHGQQIIVCDEKVFGVVKYTNLEMHFKKRICIDQGQKIALEKFCMLKALSLLDVGESVGHILGADVEIYPTFLQFAGQILAGARFIRNHQEMESDRKVILDRLKRHNLSVDEPGGSVEFSVIKKKYVFKNAILKWKKHNSEQDLDSQPSPSRVNQLNQPQIKSLSVESHIPLNRSRQFQQFLRSIIQQRQKQNTVSEKLNILQNLIYTHKVEQQKLLRFEVETSLRSLPPSPENTTLMVNYFKCLYNLYQRVSRHEQQIQVLNYIITKSRQPEDKLIYRRKLMYLMNDDSSIRRLILSEELDHQNSYFHLALAKNVLAKNIDEEAKKTEAMFHLIKGCSLEAPNDNSAFLEAAEILYTWGYNKDCKDFLRKGIKKGILINGPNHVNNSLFFKTMGRLHVQQDEYQKGLKCFQYARQILSSHSIINNQYFSIISDELVISDMLKNEQRIRQIYDVVATHVSDIKRHMHPSEYIVIFSNVGNALFSIRQHRQARAVFLQCLKYPYLIELLDNQSYVKTYSNLGCMQMKDKDYEKAQKYFKLALDREQQSFFTRKQVVDGWLSYHLHNNIAMFYYEKGEFRKSQVEFQRVLQELEHFEEQQRKVKQSLIHLYFNMSFLNRALLRTDLAVQYLQKALEKATELYGKEDPMPKLLVGQIESYKKMVIIEMPNEEESRYEQRR